jgi:hypothetical protein
MPMGFRRVASSLCTVGCFEYRPPIAVLGIAALNAAGALRTVDAAFAIPQNCLDCFLRYCLSLLKSGSWSCRPLQQNL